MANEITHIKVSQLQQGIWVEHQIITRYSIREILAAPVGYGDSAETVRCLQTMLFATGFNVASILVLKEEGRGVPVKVECLSQGSVIWTFLF